MKEKEVEDAAKSQSHAGEDFKVIWKGTVAFVSNNSNSTQALHE
jgi:hypothetical protein